MRVALILCLAFIFTSSFGAEDFYRQQTQKRISPIGQVRVNGPERAGDEKKELPAQNFVKKSPGEETYEMYCKVCHLAGIAGAPKFRDEAQWKPRMQKGLTGMVSNAIKGINAMPPKGTCLKCTDEDIRLAVEHMVPQK